MNLKSHFLLSLIIILLFAGLKTADAQQIHTYVDVDSLQVGDIFELTIVLNGHSQLLSYPAEEEFESEIDLLSADRYQTDTSSDSLVYQLQFFGTEDFTISRKAVRLSTESGDTTLYTTPVPIFFKSVLAQGEEEFRPLKPIFEFARSLLPWFVGVIILIIAGYLLYRWWLKRQQSMESRIEYTPVPFTDPIEELNNELDNLPATDGLRSFREFEQFYIKLGDAIRSYLKRVHGIPALEMTTSEITRELKSEFTSSKVVAITRKVLNSADMVKFAHFEPTPDQADKTLRKAHEFLAIVSESDSDKIQTMREVHEQREMEKVEQLDPQQE